MQKRVEMGAERYRHRQVWYGIRMGAGHLWDRRGKSVEQKLDGLGTGCRLGLVLGNLSFTLSLLYPNFVHILHVVNMMLPAT